MSTSRVPESFLTSSATNEASILSFQHRVVDMGVEFKRSIPVTRGQTDVTIPSQITFSQMPTMGMSFERLYEQFEGLVSRSSNWGSPNFLGFPDAANSVAGLGASLLIPLLNQNLANHDICSPGATFIEMEVIHWLREALGFSVPEMYFQSNDLGGIMTMGGCLSNAIAIVAARERLFPGSGLNGLPILPAHVRIIVPDVIEHYSIRASMAWLSLGELNVVRVPVDRHFQMNQDALEEVINKEKLLGHSIIACVAYAGDSRSMRIDDLNSLGDILAAHGIWFHVDACHGSQLLFSERHKHKLKGIEKADSVTIDPHKVLFVPYSCSFVFFKEPKCLAATSTRSDLILNTQWSLGKITPFMGSRAFDALKLWSVIKFFGKQRLGELVDERLDLTRAIRDEVRRRSGLVLLNGLDINSCMMIYLPEELQECCLQNETTLADPDLEKINGLNKRIRDDILARGEFYVHGFLMKSCPHPHFLRSGREIYVLRTMNGNPATTIDHVRRLLDNIAERGRKLFDKCGYRLIKLETGRDRLQCAKEALHLGISDLFNQSIAYVAVLYGSSACDGVSLLSDLDIMIFVPTAVLAYTAPLERIFRETMEEYNISIDDEVPIHRKLLVSFEFAKSVVEAGPPLDRDGKVLTIPKNPEYLCSDEMLRRLVFNVLTTPSDVISSSSDGLDFLQKVHDIASVTLKRLLWRLRNDTMDGTASLVGVALSDGSRHGEDYLGYKARKDVIRRLKQILEMPEEEVL